MYVHDTRTRRNVSVLYRENPRIALYICVNIHLIDEERERIRMTVRDSTKFPRILIELESRKFSRTREGPVSTSSSSGQTSETNTSEQSETSKCPSKRVCRFGARELPFSYEFLNHYEWSIQGIDVRDKSLICRD